MSGYSESEIAYVIPAEQIFQDIADRLGKPVELSTHSRRDSGARNRERSMETLIRELQSNYISTHETPETVYTLRLAIQDMNVAIFSYANGPRTYRNLHVSEGQKGLYERNYSNSDRAIERFNKVDHYQNDLHRKRASKPKVKTGCNNCK